MIFGDALAFPSVWPGSSSRWIFLKSVIDKSVAKKLNITTKSLERVLKNVETEISSMMKKKLIPSYLDL